MITKVTTFNLFLPSRVYFFDSSKPRKRVHFTSFQPLRSPALRVGLLRFSSFGSFHGDTFAMTSGVRQQGHLHSHAIADILAH